MNCPYCQNEQLHEGRVSCHNCGRAYKLETEAKPKIKKKPFPWSQTVIIITGMCATFLYTYLNLSSNSNTDNASIVNKRRQIITAENKYAEKISPYALSTYTAEKGYPKIVAK